MIVSKLRSFQIEDWGGKFFLTDDVWMPTPFGTLIWITLLFEAMEESTSRLWVLGECGLEGLSPLILLLLSTVFNSSKHLQGLSSPECSYFLFVRCSFLSDWGDFWHLLSRKKSNKYNPYEQQKKKIPSKGNYYTKLRHLFFVFVCNTSAMAENNPGRTRLDCVS